MAESDRKESETAASSPSSSHNAGPNGLRAVKDRNCPYCGQAFTSSSLGRHLDLYIKPKNPKPPDGIHDVEGIRNLRGGITRRQPKANLKEGANINASGWLKEPANSEGTSKCGLTSKSTAPKLDNAILAESSAATSPTTTKDDEKYQTFLNAPNWQATGIINNLPPRVPSRSHAPTPTGQTQRMHEMRKDTMTGQKIQRPDYEVESMWKLQEDAEVGRAAELAFRELMSSLQAAQQKVESKQLFDGIDFLSLSFPALCLAILPEPPTLFSTTPFPGSESWALAPPGRKQFESLNRLVHQQIAAIREGDDSRFPSNLAFKHSMHVQRAYEHWQAMSDEERASAWTLETLRAFARMKEEKSATRQKLEAAHTRIRHLEAEFDRLSRFQLPREYLLYPPNTIPISAPTLKEFGNINPQSCMELASYDADAIINKWRAIVRAMKRRPLPSKDATQTASEPNPTDQRYESSNMNVRSSASMMRGDMILNGSVFGINGAMPRKEVATSALTTDNVAYETPPNPGTVMDDEEDCDTAANPKKPIVEDSECFSLSAERMALVKNGGQHGDKNDVINANGKRPIDPAAVYGRADGPKMYKDQRDGRPDG